MLPMLPRRLALSLIATAWLLAGALLPLAAAEKEQKKSCDVQLAEHSVRVHHLSAHREELEKKVAEVQTQLYLLNQQKLAIEKQLDAMKSEKSEPTPK